MIIDIYTHVFPKNLFDALVDKGIGNLAKRMQSVKSVYDLDSRFREMDKVDDYRQIISLPHPVLEELFEPKEASRLSSSANDGLAEMCARHPDRFAGFVAAVAMTDVDGAVQEAERAVRQLGACGIQVYTNVVGEPLEDPKFEPVFAKMSELGRPIWMHPARSASMPDYPSEKKSRYEMWWCFGWPYETTVAASRLVLSGMFDRYPGLNIVTHHLGGMIPFFDGRIETGLQFLGSRTPDEDYSHILPSLKRPLIEYFKMFYADTAMMGGTAGLPCGLKFFGSEHVVFASDAPFGDIAPALKALNDLPLSVEARNQIMYGNAERIVKMKFA